MGQIRIIYHRDRYALQRLKKGAYLSFNGYLSPYDLHPPQNLMFYGGVIDETDCLAFAFAYDIG